MFKGRVAILLATGIAALGLNVTMAGPAFAATSVTPGTVTPSPAAAGANSTYTIPFTAATALPSGGTITLVAPAETDFSGSGADYAVAVNNSHAATVGSVSATAPSGGTNNQVVITLSSSTIAAGDTVTVTASQTRNPQTASTTDTMQESTSADTTPASSPNYTISSNLANSISVVQGSPNSAKVSTAFSPNMKVLVTDAYGNPVAGVLVTFTAPTSGASGTFASCPQNVTGTNPTPANQCLVNTDGNGFATASAFTANSTASPGTCPNQTPYSVSASVSPSTTHPTTSFTLTNLPASGCTAVTPGAVTVSPATVGNSAAQYTVHFTTNSAIPLTDYIQLIAPIGTTFTSTTGNYAVSYDNSGTTVNVEITGVSVSISNSPPGEKVQISLGPAIATPSPDSIPAGKAVTVIISGATNPTVAKPSYSIIESDQVDTIGVGSGTYAITPGSPAKISVVSGSNQKAAVNTAFSAPLVALVEDSHNNPVGQGIPVTFTLAANPTTNPSGSFPGSSSQQQQTNFTDASGQSTSSTVTANNIAGAWTATAGINSGSVKTSFALTNVAPGVPTTIVVDSGGGQSAQVGTQFAAPVVVTVQDGLGNPVTGATVYFGDAASGATASFPGSSPHLVSTTTDASGQATSPAFTASSTAGTWSMGVALNGGPSVLAQETNTAGTATRMSTVQGSGQSAHLGDYFSKRLEVKVVDANGNAVAGQSVSFSTPGLSHATGIFVGRPFGAALSVTVQTGSDGIATAPALLSWELPGSFQATAASTINGTRQTVHFQLASTDGYWLAGSDGSVQTFGDAPFLGSMSGTKLVKPVVGMAAVPAGSGYWLVASDGGLFSFGPSAHFYGSMGGRPLNKPIVAIAPTPDGKGYYMVASDGGLFAFGDAHFHGSMGGQHLNQPIVGMTVTGDGNGYWLVASDGGLFAFGDARFKGSMGGTPLNKPVVGMSATPDGEGYWLVASDGGIFAFGDAHFYGSTGNIALSQPIVGMATTPSGGGYWFVAADGGVFNYGPEAGFYGSGSGVGEPVVAIAEG